MSAADVFLWPEAAPLLLIAPLVLLLARARDRARVRKLARAVGARAPVLGAEVDPGRRRIARWLAASGALLALVALLQPRWGTGSREVAPRGADVVVCLDVSRSMLARDVAPTRLEAARRMIRELALHARGTRLALVVFAGEARMVTPLTEDPDSFAELAGLADPLAVGLGGTDVGAALTVALDALSGASGDHAAVVLVSDGEDLEGRGLRAAEEFRKRGIAVHAVGIGTEGGSKIPVETEHGESFLRDSSGREVVTAPDPNGLRRIAEAAGGRYADGTDGRALVELHDRAIAPAARRGFETRAGHERPNRFQWPLLLALVLWLAELAWSHRRSP